LNFNVSAASPSALAPSRTNAFVESNALKKYERGKMCTLMETSVDNFGRM
jgi:hypothetical protein